MLGGYFSLPTFQNVQELALKSKNELILMIKQKAYMSNYKLYQSYKPLFCFSSIGNFVE